MKTIGLLGGMSWESTVSYYRLINEGVKRSRGGLHSAKIVLYSVDFATVEELQRKGDWDALADQLSDAARKLQAAGADFLLICTNTMHKVAPQIETAVTIPLLHIADATAALLAEKGLDKVALLGTAYTMEQDFYKQRLKEKYGISVLIPSDSDRKRVHTVIFDELCMGQATPSAKEDYLRIISDLAKNGAQAIILGCTEIGLLVQQTDTPIQLFDTTLIHAQRAVRVALDDSQQI